MRTALLNAVSHDLRTPLASAKAAISGLRSPGVEFSAADRAELLATADESLVRLERLVENLLDMSRLQAGVLAVSPRLMSIGESIPAAVDDLGGAGRQVEMHVPDELPDVFADPALLERALANLLSNAVRHSPDGRPPLIVASDHAGHVEVRIVDHGPGVPSTDWDTIFMPFQRLGDRDTTTGVGLGLALSRGLVEAMGGTLVPEATAGGGLTMTLTLPAATPGEPGRATGKPLPEAVMTQTPYTAPQSQTVPSPVPGYLGSPREPRDWPRDAR
jgi:two-component system sensor histidine kinase KdpD